MRITDKIYKILHALKEINQINKKEITIIVPVYGDWPSLSACIASLKKYTKKTQKIIFINDCGPEVDNIEVKIKKEIQGFKNYVYFRNASNIGFVQSCNKAVLTLDGTKNDILLLNSDTEVTKDFLIEMVRALYRAPNIASVSPRSNKANIFSVPYVTEAKKAVTPQESYRLYKKIKQKLPEVYETPTTHGFCMLIKRRVIQEFGLFDEIYGKGYAEENDFCMRVKRHGYTHAIANKSFVFHEGSKSFTPEVREKIVVENAEILNDRYPEYIELVSEYYRTVVVPEQAYME